jgi:hypothetical protein
MSERPIFILGVHKSGTSLLRSLLDGHPALHAIPLETHFPWCLGLPCQYPRRHARGVHPMDHGSIQARMRSVVEEYQRGGDPRADAYLPGRFNLAAFDAYLASHLPAARSIAEQFTHYRDAIQQSLTGSPVPPGLRSVEKSVDNVEHAAWLLKHFPGARFVFILRNPYANLHSFGRFTASKGRFPSLAQPLRTIELGFHFAALYRSTMPEVHIVRYEDLLTAPRPTMTAIADHLDLPWDDTLLSPTALGESWGGNSGTGQAMERIDPTQAERWKADISAIEVDLVNRSSLRGYLEDEGYPPHTMKGVWQPEPGTSWRTYLRNRLFRLFTDGS